MWLNLEKVFDALSHDPNVRAVVLTAAGDRAWCAGLDVQVRKSDPTWFISQVSDYRQAAAAGNLSGDSKLDGARQSTKMRRHIIEFQRCITSLERCEKRSSTPLSLLLQRVLTFGRSRHLRDTWHLIRPCP